ncbi:hypothetical protein UCH007_05090 [Dehalococcoides sp. UCH007]|nr:hypothetical protein UCH007_05090 [Dehalococcoides sp. UCH007]
MNMNMIKQAMELKSKLDKAQKELAKVVVETESAKGAIKIKMNGQQKVLSLSISPEIINPSKPKDLENALIKAFNDAYEETKKEGSKQMQGLMGDVKIPGLM